MGQNTNSKVSASYATHVMFLPARVWTFRQDEPPSIFSVVSFADLDHLISREAT